MNQKLWDTGKAVLRGKFAVIQAYLRKLENFQISNLTLQLKKQENEEQQKPKPNQKYTLKKNQTQKNVSRKKERKIRGEINGDKGKKESVKL